MQAYSAGSQEVVDLLVEVDGTGEILLASSLSLNKMVAVDLSIVKRDESTLGPGRLNSPLAG